MLGARSWYFTRLQPNSPRCRTYSLFTIFGPNNSFVHGYVRFTWTALCIYVCTNAWQFPYFYLFPEVCTRCLAPPSWYWKLCAFPFAVFRCGARARNHQPNRNEFLMKKSACEAKTSEWAHTHTPTNLTSPGTLNATAHFHRNDNIVCYMFHGGPLLLCGCLIRVCDVRVAGLECITTCARAEREREREARKDISHYAGQQGERLQKNRKHS